MPLRSRGDCGVGRGLSGLSWVWCNGRVPHLEERLEPQGSSPFLTPIAMSLRSSDRRVRPRLVWRNGTPLASRVVHGVTGHFRAGYGTCGFSGRCTGVSVLLRVCLHPQSCLPKGVWSSSSYQERTGKSGSLGMWHHPRSYISNFFVRPASS